jgi:carboxyl-terminal processing protease
MKKYCSLLLLLFLFGFNICVGQLPDSIKNHIDSSIAVLKNHSLYAKNVNWEEVEKKVYEKARGATTKAKTFDALKIAFNALGDKHAAYYQYEDQYRIENVDLIARYSDSLKAAWSRGPKITNKMIGNIAYISIPFIGANSQEDIDKYANKIYDAVIELYKKDPKGWIIDLRLNAGGNIRPMLAGLSMFFKDGIVSYYVDRDGTATDETAFSHGDLTIAGVKQATINNKVPDFKSNKIAILIGPGTASSGEGVAVVFKQRKMAKLFGEVSAGLANSTEGFVFNNNESYFLISTAYLADKRKKLLAEFVRPDVTVKGNDAFNDLANDNVVKEAIKWLK